ncbi:YheC/YheD family protein [Paenibacillus sp. N1-5-1-14]|uniref:YheC/YheD family protein n=1 Tax=Paenibacillus radicibacter TaxID=2972488 RepID=UPI0021592B58|nr:YheC/YheD family protein [Paenibacillus radicibacter]MCR8643482.1 YheC/YheD family protein [Paenibacillus radicibacter]
MIYPNTKLGKYEFLKQNADFAEYLPQTYEMTDENIKLLFQENKTIFAKSNTGFGGFGVIRINQLSPTRYQTIHSNDKVYTFDSFEHLYNYLMRMSGGKTYVVQAGLQLLTYDRKPFDIRIMIQKNRSGEWVTTGIVGRLAKRGKVITNFMNGGKVYPLTKLLSAYYERKERDYYIERLERYGKRIAVYMSQGYPGFRAFGVDIGMSKDFKPWIIEVNTKPGTILFKHMKDRTMYRRVMRYTKYKSDSGGEKNASDKEREENKEND